MRLELRQMEARNLAKDILDPAVYALLLDAIINNTSVAIRYTDRHGVESKYTGVSPDSFFQCDETDIWPGAVYLWAYHSKHGKKEQYRVDRITSATRIMSLMDAMLNPSRAAAYWYGIQTF